MGGEVIMMIVVVVVVSKYERLTKRKSVKRNLLPYFEFVKYFRIVFFLERGNYSYFLGFRKRERTYVKIWRDIKYVFT